MFSISFLTPFSNREDFLQTVGVFDDDTGDGINLHRSTTVIPQAFTGSAWTVTDGSIITTSATQLTIPVFPIGSQLLSVALTVGTGLAILPGDLVTIKDTPTGQNTMTGYVTSYASGTGALVVQVSFNFQFEIRELMASWAANLDSIGYIPWFDWGTPLEAAPILTASLGIPTSQQGALSIVDFGRVQIFIPEAQWRTLTHHTFLASMTMFDGFNTKQLFVGRLPIGYGGVTI